jgi:hypothetical protein
MATRTVVPTARGQDLEAKAAHRDAHIRLEEGEIHVDVFNSEIEDSSKAHIEPEAFPKTIEGAQDATDFLDGHGFRVKVLPRRGSKG